MSGKKPVQVPETVVGAEGSSKRNIIRKNNKGGNKGGKKENAANSISIDDGSLYDEKVIDEADPNYDSEEETGSEYIPRVSSLRRSVASASITLTTYKKTIGPLIKEFFVSGDNEDIFARYEVPPYHPPFRALNLILGIVYSTFQHPGRRSSTVHL